MILAKTNVVDLEKNSKISFLGHKPLKGLVLKIKIAMWGRISSLDLYLHHLTCGLRLYLVLLLQCHILLTYAEKSIKD